MASNEPNNIKEMEMDDEELRMLPSSESKHINDLPPENLGQILRCGLSVIDRLHCAGVSRHWKWAVGEFAWTEQKKLDRDTVFEGATPRQIERFTGEHLISLLERFGPSLLELDLVSFGLDRLQQFVPQIAKALEDNCPKLEKLNITDFDLADFVAFLPSTLRQLESSGEIEISVQTLETLALRCPNLEEVPFTSVQGITLRTVNRFLGKFLRLKRLDLSGSAIIPVNGLTEIWRLNHLEVLEFFISRWDFDEQIVEVMVAGCPRLRKIIMIQSSLAPPLPLWHLAELPSLTVFEFYHPFNYSVDGLLRAIAARGQLKRLKLRMAWKLTDDVVEFLIDRCKSLVSLEFVCCHRLTDRTLDAVISEVRRRHGALALPAGPHDPGIFYFRARASAIDDARLVEANNDNPWLETMTEDPREII